MANQQLPTLHLICGKIAAGKSTKARELAASPGTVLVSEDQWLAGLYPGELKALPDYVRFSGRLRAVMGPHVEALLKAGLSVVLDFQANTVNSRKWMRTIFENAGVAHRLHFLDVPNEVCKARLRARNQSGEHEFSTTDAVFDEFTGYFVPPSPDEGFSVVVCGPP